MPVVVAVPGAAAAAVVNVDVGDDVAFVTAAIIVEGLVGVAMPSGAAGILFGIRLFRPL